MKTTKYNPIKTIEDKNREKACYLHNSPDCEQCFSGSVENDPKPTQTNPTNE